MLLRDNSKNNLVIPNIINLTREVEHFFLEIELFELCHRALQPEIEAAK